MLNPETLDAREVEFQRRWHHAHVARFKALITDSHMSWRERNIVPHTAEGLQHLEGLRRNGDLGAFQQATDRWSRSFQSGYGGVAGQMILNQVNKLSPDPVASVEVVVDALTAPVDLGDAVRKIRLLVEHLQDIRVGAHPSPKRAPFVAPGVGFSVFVVYDHIIRGACAAGRVLVHGDLVRLPSVEWRVSGPLMDAVGRRSAILPRRAQNACRSWVRATFVAARRDPTASGSYAMKEQGSSLVETRA